MKTRVKVSKPTASDNNKHSWLPYMATEVVQKEQKIFIK